MSPSDARHPPAPALASWSSDEFGRSCVSATDFPAAGFLATGFVPATGFPATGFGGPTPPSPGVCGGGFGSGGLGGGVGVWGPATGVDLTGAEFFGSGFGIAPALTALGGSTFGLGFGVSALGESTNHTPMLGGGVVDHRTSSLLGGALPLVDHRTSVGSNPNGFGDPITGLNLPAAPFFQNPADIFMFPHADQVPNTTTYPSVAFPHPPIANGYHAQQF